MKTIREQFEEIWPVPEGVEWGAITGVYFAHYHMAQESAVSHNARLDTFTRCQETTEVYVSLIGEFVRELENAAPWIHDSNQYCFAAEVVDRAKQIMEQKK